MVDQLSRSDAHADEDDTVSIDGSSNGTVLDKLDDTKTQKVGASEDLTSGLDIKKVFDVCCFFIILCLQVKADMVLFTGNTV